MGENNEFLYDIFQKQVKRDINVFVNHQRSRKVILLLPDNVPLIELVIPRGF
ncbi:MAG: hypothetical protein CM15mV142_030 [Caudoviricetes sp.]|nr:MAG: hypothetical protein CM15mV142_030 [Caudoviricetes sp.]